uniref:Uncharacterized mitochondrial protein n=1 Tax=Solanum tuberosum TaxID=4113 RepID=M1A7V5_SOLTU
YALLGDDILITDKKVANQYSRLLDRLSVTISFAKSIVSINGTIDFAKRFRIRDMQKDISPISLKALTSRRMTVGLCQLSSRYSIEISTLKRLAGAGYKVFGVLHGKDLPSLQKMDIDDKNLGASEYINPFGKIPQGTVTKRAIVVAVWLIASTNTEPTDKYYVIEESGSTKYRYETGYARTGPHLDLNIDNLLYYPKESYSYPGHFLLERASSV